jgi:hypothetical protein
MLALSGLATIILAASLLLLTGLDLLLLELAKGMFAILFVVVGLLRLSPPSLMVCPALLLAPLIAVLRILLVLPITALALLEAIHAQVFPPIARTLALATLPLATPCLVARL